MIWGQNDNDRFWNIVIIIYEKQGLCFDILSEVYWHCVHIQIMIGKIGLRTHWIISLVKLHMIHNDNNMWCDHAKSVWSRSYSIFSFLLNCKKHLQSYILQKTPLKLNNQFKRYQQLKSFQNKKKQKEILPLFGYISKSIFPTSDWFCLITSHMWPSTTKPV